MEIKRIVKCVSLAVIGVIIISLLTACNTRDNRAWIENKFAKDLSRVYPTKNIEELSKEFPEGFGVEQVYRTKSYFSVVKLEMKDRKINGTFIVIDKTNKKSDVIIEKPVEIKDGNFVVDNLDELKKYWPVKGFLFQNKIINKHYLNSLKMKDKEYNFQNGAFGIDYYIQDEEINKFTNSPKSEKAILSLGSSNMNKDDYYNTVSIEYSVDSYYMERIYNK